MPNITIRKVEGQEMLDILYRLDNYAFQPNPPFPKREEWEGHIKSRVGTLYYALFEDGEGVAIASCASILRAISASESPWALMTSPESSLSSEK